MEKLLSTPVSDWLMFYGPTLAQVLGVFLVSWFILRFLKRYCGPFFWVCRIAIWGFAVILVLSNLGYNVTSLVAGLGIGGVALALAAQETLSNAFGYLSIVIDKPFKVGHEITVDKYTGKVLSMGLRSTRIETKDKVVVYIPNKTMAALPIENLSQK